MAEPIIRRKFQYVDLEDNSNKWWMIELWADGKLRTTFGRVGYEAGQSEKAGMTEHDAERLIAQKQKKGYTEVSLLQVAQQPNTILPFAGPASNYVNDLLYEAGEAIKEYLSISVNDLSLDQIAKGRAILANFNQMWARVQPYNSTTFAGRHNNMPTYQKMGGMFAVTEDQLIAKMEEYYRAIPTQLPHKIDAKQLMLEFGGKLQDEEDKLDQLEAAVKKAVPQIVNGVVTNNPLGETSLELLASNTPKWQFVQKYLKESSSSRLMDVLLVKIPKERETYNISQVGKNNVTNLWHGTNNKNGVHILRSGLIIPKYAANGSRFGRGIYFADKAKRSIGYTGYVRKAFRMLFLCDVALGNPKKMSGDDSNLYKAPPGYDSVWGTNSWSGMDEFIVYSTAQQTIRAIAFVER